jgi:phosphatidylethanolamine/phosphatidyl-N-methylethanolamine N-methyltransferase
MMNADLDHAAMEKAYARWAPVYDMVCGPFFRSGRKAAAKRAGDLGKRVLEVGVGTGLSFEDYSEDRSIIGIDASAEMIDRARRRMETRRYPQVKALHVMDAHDLSFAGGTFDVVVAQFVITLVQRPERVLDECARVLRSGGAIVLVNHFKTEQGLAARLERRFSQQARRVGLRPDFPFQRIEAWAAKRSDIRIAARRDIAPLNWFTLVEFEKA